jgi:hypothetical protein
VRIEDVDVDLDHAVEAALYAARLVEEVESSASGGSLDRPQADDPAS